MSKKVRNNKFIGAFVNEMYAILLGIGLGNVLFVQQIDLNNKFELLMGLFVTGIVLLYWWDWTEFLGDNVVSSKAEFIIDFLILINLEVLFLFYNKPENIALIFILLALLDFAWVINYIIQNKGNYIAKNKTWISEKIVALVLFTTLYFLLKYTFSDIELIYKGLTTILTFILVRKISFKQLKNAPRYSLEIAKPEDYEVIAEINNSYFDPEKNKAFMITEMTEDIILERIHKNYRYYVLRKFGNEEILGFVELSNTVGVDILSRVNWKTDKFKKQILENNDNLLYIEKVAVDKSYKKQGVGEALYKNLFAKYSNNSFYAFVMDKPYTNEISMNFHKKLGFEEAGILKLDKFKDFKDYQSKIYYKN
ncbi:MAG: GNAT family N-acetyltransferase [Bacteroidota bacterium]|nr:GNAT family N-acetyltransferase [Bacteroidota bacterium]